MSEIVVIYDGQCELCRNSISWIQKKLDITALDFHIADLSILDLTKEQCSREVFVVTQNARASGASAVALLLNRRGNKFLATLITISGPIARTGYKWIAANRNSILVRVLTLLIGRTKP
jgi:predicted DCC family thiol-disulfide oxidoreductase YuxK